ncbi:MAG TPA: hypothetical protein VFF44_12170 [Casimicrobiaceae bacterium]|nr:hypothetical protein [Casimicrobiaceae bacterium]
MTTSKTERKSGAAGRHKAARPTQGRQIGRRAPASKRMQNETPRSDRQSDRMEDESTVARSERREHDLPPEDEGLEGSER